MSSPHNRRQHFRIEYPISLLPTLVLGEERFSILELSEGGAKIKAEEFPLRIGQVEAATLELISGERLQTRIELVRSGDRSCAIKFVIPVELSAIMAEQRKLIAIYGKDFFRRGRE